MLRQHPVFSQRIGLAAGGGQQRVQAQALVILEVFVAQGRAEDALAQEFLNRMVYPVGVTLVVKTLRQFRGRPEVNVNLAQQQRAGVTGKGAAGEIGLHPARAQVIKEKRLIGYVHEVSL